MDIQLQKYENAILFLCQKLGGTLQGKKKLAKLLYFVDFDLFEKEGRSLTGDRYNALPMGPVPNALAEVTGAMVANHKISIEQIPGTDGYLPTETYKLAAQPDLSVFDTAELDMLERIIVKYGHLNGKQLQELSHAEAPYAGTKPNQEIAYELAYYRGTDFKDL